MQQFTMKVIVVTGETFELIIGFLKIIQETFKNPGKSRKKSPFNLYLRVD